MSMIYKLSTNQLFASTSLRIGVVLLLCLAFSAKGNGAAPVVDAVEPASWWVGMKEPRLQLLLHGAGIATGKVSLAAYEGVKLERTLRMQSPNYLAVYLTISGKAKAGVLKLTLTTAGGVMALPYTLEARKTQTEHPRGQGYLASDMLYLIMPDRFSNGNAGNDNVAGMGDALDRKAPFGRHGGDLEGITAHLEYLDKLGVTGVWLNPVQENKMPSSSYHGYAITDYYAVDARFGGMPAYKTFIKAAHGRKMKVVMDMVMNHCGTGHKWMVDMPDTNWLNNWPTYTQSNFHATTVADPHASTYDKERMQKGWFSESMPDLNQKHPVLADYLIQNCIWWVEETGIDGIRMDTYPYPDQPFMNRWASAIMAEYPRFKLTGEVWVGQPALSAYFEKGDHPYKGFAATLPTVIDFPLRDAIVNGLNENGGWDNGLAKVYNTLAQDYLFAKPENHLIFTSNHDMTRLATALNKDTAKYKQALVLLSTLRGIPHLYYGEEWMEEGDGGFHPSLRRDVPGGWAADLASPDSANYFTGAKMPSKGLAMRNWFTKLLQWRKTSAAIAEGTLTHFIPEDNVYVYFRKAKAGGKNLMVIINGNDSPKGLQVGRFTEGMGKATKGRDVLTGATIELRAQGPRLELPTRAAYVLELE
jgi:neopullulanase